MELKKVKKKLKIKKQVVMNKIGELR